MTKRNTHSSIDWTGAAVWMALVLAVAAMWYGIAIGIAALVEATA